MCKNFMLTNTAKLTEEQFLKLRAVVARIITSSNDKDGFGYVTIGQDGVPFGERFLDTVSPNFQLAPDITTPVNVTEHTPKAIYQPPSDIPEEFHNLFEYERIEQKEIKPSNFFGSYSKPKGAFLAHGRFSTNKICIENTHPHQSAQWSLIHNGVVQNAGKCKTWRTTCDTEYLVKYLTDGGLNGMVKNVTGYFAIGAIHHASGRLLVARDATTPLFAAWCADLETFLIATSSIQLADIIKEMSFVTSKVRALSESTAWDFDIDGKLLNTYTIETKSYKTTYYPSDYLSEDKDKPKKNKASSRDYYGRRGDVSTNGNGFFTNDDFDYFYRFTLPNGVVISFETFCKLTLKMRDKVKIYDKETGIDTTEAFFYDHPEIA